MFQLTATNKVWRFENPQIMGIINATPDSFYEGSRMVNLEQTLENIAKYVENGADIIDIGGQSTRPGATFISVQEELDRVLPIIQAVSTHFPEVLIAVDSFRAQVAEAAISAGANIVNDISAGSFDPDILNVVAKYQATYIGMHITGNMESMHLIPDRTSIMAELLHYFKAKKALLASYGIFNWVIDPGFGFGKTIAENFELIKSLKSLESLELPILLGVSRKSSIYKTLGIGPAEALNGTTILHTIGILNGASILRVHDVKEAKEVVALMKYLK